MTLDSELAREIRRANGDGTRAAGLELLRKVKAAKADLSSPDVREHFDDALKKHGRVPVAICVGVTAVLRADSLNRWIVGWGRDVLQQWAYRPFDLTVALIEDNLAPSRIEEYAGSFVRATTDRNGGA